MSFYDRIADAFSEFDRASASAQTAEGSLAKRHLGREDFLALLLPSSDALLERMAARAADLTLRNFGRTMQLFTPLYLSNHCVNQCLYCGFNATNKVQRGKLSIQEARDEGRKISETGLRSVLLLTGESREKSPVSYIGECIGAMKDLFDSISVEIYPLDSDEYAHLIECGCDGLTLFQECYDETEYLYLHPAGPKRNFRYRVDAPERACEASMRNVNIGALLGLSDWRREVFLTGLHADYLQKKFPSANIGIALPRMRPRAGSFNPAFTVTDRDFVHAMLALRNFLPSASITVSTRERPELRDRIIGLGITRMSAGVSTGIGGRCIGEKGSAQFEISDERGVGEICGMLAAKGYDAVFKDWMNL